MNKRPTLSPPNPDPVLHAKLMPPRLPSSLVHRGDLLKQLDSGLTRKLTLVTAPTGYGNHPPPPVDCGPENLRCLANPRRWR